MSPRLLIALSACALVACQDQLSLDACDIREASCQNDVFLAVQAVRGTGWDPWLEPPPMRVITRDQFRSEVEAATKARGDQPEAYDYFTPAYKLFGLYDPDEMPQAATDFTVSFVAAYYDDGSDTVTIIDRGGKTDLREDTTTLAHELVHAAQRRDVGFGTIATWGSTADNVNARYALVEGEATLYENLVDTLLRKLSAHDLQWDKYHADWIASARKQIAMDPAPWRLARSSLRYPLGSRLLTTVWLKAGPLGVRRALAAHPTTTRYLMDVHGSHIAEGKVPEPCKAPTPPEGYKVISTTTLGAWASYAFATRMLMESDAWNFGRDTRSDAFTIYANDDKQLAVVWQLQFRSEAVAGAFVEALAELPDNVHLSSAQDGDRVSLVAFSTPDAQPEFDWMSCS